MGSYIGRDGTHRQEYYGCGLMSLGVKMPIAPFFSLTTPILLVMSAGGILYAQPRKATP
ncbi:MAG: hypothetical protein LUP97_02515 [Methanoregula sp.]|nr:hypothetical protein [Methanoregula sp.]